MEPHSRHRGGLAQARELCHSQQRLHWIMFDFLGIGAVAATIPNRRIEQGSDNLASSGKLMIQQEYGRLGLSKLYAVSVAAIGGVPIASLMA